MSSSDAAWQELISALHASGRKAALAITGGGSGAVGELLRVPGGSRLLIEAQVPYDALALATFLGSAPAQACSSETAIATALDRKRRIDTAYEVYLGLYQAITGPEERQKLFREFSPGFFDLIVIDECHRGSAAEDSAWREILEYFSAATQIGLTATPKETEYVSNIHYFGKPVYTYSPNKLPAGLLSARR